MTEPQIRVSVVIPVYNGGSFLSQAIESVLAQTWPYTEIIVVNDGSRDNGHTRSVATSFGSRIRYIEQKNGGVAAALNTGIRAMSGDFFCWLSHDDLFRKEKIEKQIKFFLNTNRKNLVLFSDYDIIDEENNPVTEVRADRKMLLRAPMIALLRGCINGCTIFIPKEVLEKVGIFEEKYKFVQDYRYWNNLLRLYEFIHVPEILVSYRRHEAQASNHPGTVDEGNALWIDMMADRSDVEKALISGSSYRFYVEMAKHLKLSPYRGAMEYALARRDAAVTESSVSIVVPSHRFCEATKQTLHSALRLRHSKLEVILLTASAHKFKNTGDGDVIEEGLRRGRLTILPTPGLLDLSDAEIFNACLNSASSDYTNILLPGSTMTDDQLFSRLSGLQRFGGNAAVFDCENEGKVNLPELLSGAYDAPQSNPIERIMFHRTAVASGFSFRQEAMSFGLLPTLAPLATASWTHPLGHLR